MIGYYDMVLGLIPVVLFGGASLLHLSGFRLTIAVPLSGLLAAGLVGHAMFVRAPIDTPVEPSSPAPEPPAAAAD